jgi:hypothetical protein
VLRAARAHISTAVRGHPTLLHVPQPGAARTGFVRNWPKGDTTATKKHEAALRQLRELSLLAGEGRGCGAGGGGGGAARLPYPRILLRGAAAADGMSCMARACSPLAWGFWFKSRRAHKPPCTCRGAAAWSLIPVFRQQLRAALAGRCARSGESDRPHACGGNGGRPP